MKTSIWLLISAAVHGLFWALLGSSFILSKTPRDVVDLTLMSLPAPLGSAQNDVPSKKLPAATKKNQKAVITKEATTASSKAEEISSQEVSSEMNEGPGTPLSWSEVSKFPRVKREVKAAYPEEAKKAGIDGAVILELVIDRDGKVQDVHVVSGPGYGLNESAIEALKKFEFQPAFKGEESVAVKIRYTYRFRLDIQ